MKFIIEQIAICPRDPAAAKKLLSEMGAQEWVEDHVKAEGRVWGKAAANEADLSFNYDLLAGAKEFEVLHYTAGDNWMAKGARPGSVSHLGMHCSAEALFKWRAFFEERGIKIAQEVFTTEHTNPAIAGKRKYNYVIFNTRAVLGVDLKFIVRHDEA